MLETPWPSRNSGEARDCLACGLPWPSVASHLSDPDSLPPSYVCRMAPCNSNSLLSYSQDLGFRFPTIFDSSPLFFFCLMCHWVLSLYLVNISSLLIICLLGARHCRRCLFRLSSLTFITPTSPENWGHPMSVTSVCFPPGNEALPS